MAAWRADRIPKGVRRTVLILAAVVVAEYFALPQLVTAEGELGVLAGLSAPLMVTALAFEAASWFAFSGLTRMMLPAEDRPGYGTLVLIDLCYQGLVHVLPGGTTSAAAVRYRMLVSAGSSPPDALAAATMESVGSNLALGAVFAGGVVLVLPAPHLGVYIEVAGAAVLVLLIAAASAAVLLRRHLDAGVSAVRATARRLRVIRQDAAEAFVRRLARQLDLFELRPRAFWLAALLALANWLLDAVALWLVLAAFGEFLSVPALLAAYGLASILASLPLTPGGIGIVEGALVPVLVELGADRPEALLGVIGWRLLEYWLPIPLAGVAYLLLRLHRHPRRHTGAGSGSAAGSAVTPREQ